MELEFPRNRIEGRPLQLTGNARMQVGSRKVSRAEGGIADCFSLYISLIFFFPWAKKEGFNFFLCIVYNIVNAAIIPVACCHPSASPPDVCPADLLGFDERSFLFFLFSFVFFYSISPQIFFMWNIVSSESISVIRIFILRLKVFLDQLDFSDYLCRWHTEWGTAIHVRVLQWES
jgi:hypothetical protein